MKRTPLARRTPLKRWSPIRQVNPVRSKARRGKCFGAQAQLCREMQCCVCSVNGKTQSRPTVAHHEPPRSVGGIDCDTVPLCRHHHERRHTVGVETFWSGHGIDWRDVVQQMRAAVALFKNGRAA